MYKRCSSPPPPPQTVLPHLRRYDVSAPGLVADITTYMQSPVTSASMLQAKSKAERKQVAEMAANYQLTKGLVTLFSLDPMLAFSYPNEVGGAYSVGGRGLRVV